MQWNFTACKKMACVLVRMETAEALSKDVVKVRVRPGRGAAMDKRGPEQITSEKIPKNKKKEKYLHGRGPAAGGRRFSF